MNFLLTHVTTVGGFVGIQFELGKGTPARHFIYFDYGFGWLTQGTDIEDLDYSTTSTLTHLIRVGADVPLAFLDNTAFKGIGTGIELTWLAPQEGDVARTFSIAVKAKYRF